MGQLPRVPAVGLLIFAIGLRPRYANAKPISEVTATEPIEPQSFDVPLSPSYHIR
ncbi:MAG: hypothetical protein F6J98_47155 [Moorea sp. SIO4G2]|nr:hypothetical protein [Moorena sp. SIO4G2]